MKCVAEVTCQAANAAGRITYYPAGTVDDFPECPVHFRVLTSEVDFATASEEELLEADWDFSAAAAWVKKEHNATLRKSRDRVAIVRQIMDARDRAIIPGAMGVGA